MYEFEQSLKEQIIQWRKFEDLSHDYLESKLFFKQDLLQLFEDSKPAMEYESQIFAA